MKADGFCFLPTIFSSSQVNSARDALWDVIQGKYETGVEPEERFWSIGDDPRIGMVVHFCTDIAERIPISGENSDYLNKREDESICPVIYSR